MEGVDVNIPRKKVTMYTIELAVVLEIYLRELERLFRSFAKRKRKDITGQHLQSGTQEGMSRTLLGLWQNERSDMCPCSSIAPIANV